MKIVPNMLVKVQLKERFYIGEAMSFETPDRTAIVRRVPGHPGTLEEMPVGILSKPLYKPRWVHYATAEMLEPHTCFPVDMLRYDVAVPVNFRLGDNCFDDSHNVLVDERMGLTGLVVATTTTSKAQKAWTPERWHTFGWHVQPLRTERIG
jgi:hypothetical protein